MADAEDTPTVCVGYVHDTEVAHSWSDSFLQSGFYDGGRTLRGVIKIRATTGQIDDARNNVVREFLKREEDWLWFLDTDMGFIPSTLHELLAVADPEERPVVGALCFAQKEVENDGFSGSTCRPRPVIVDLVEMQEGGKPVERYVARAWYAPNNLTRCAATGMACVVIHRSVLEKVRDEHGEAWYDRLPGFGLDADKLMGEDVSFCDRLRRLDIPVHVHAGVRTTHLKPVWLNEADFWQSQVAPPAEQRTLVVVPVLHRPANADPFMTSLRASTGLADVVVVADEDDILTIAAWQEQGAIVLKGKEHTFSEKLNRAYRDFSNTAGWVQNNDLDVAGVKWLFMCGDDVQFYPGWLDHAQWMADSFKAKVIGTNDLGNPRVMAGEHGTHLLIEMEYIEDQGASWDGPGIVAHEGYRHWFVDDEIVTAAKQRGVWISALGSVVEHLHFLWQKGATDAVYAEGQEKAEQDKALHERRLRTYAADAS